MGAIIGRQMDDNMKKQQLFMLEQQRIVLERQIQMQNQMRERMMAMQIAGGRDMFYWFGSFYLTAAAASVAGFMKTKKPAAIIPLLPLSFIMGYQYDMAYGGKMHRIKNEADHIMSSESDLLLLAGGLPTYHSVEEGRHEQRKLDKIDGHQIFL